MIDPLKTVASVSSSNADRRGSDQEAHGAAQPPPAPKAQVQDEPLRLVIEPKPGAQGYTYKLFDRVTGQLLIELPREEAVRMRDDPSYSAGQVFDAKA